MGLKKVISVVAIFCCTNSILAQLYPSHTVVVIIENKNYADIVGNVSAPYINGLLANGHTASFTQSISLTHPSQPNYLMLFSGSTQGVTNNYVSANLPFTTPNLGAEVVNAGLTFTGYSEDLNYTGSTDSIVNKYVRRHNPWVNWQGNGTNGISPNANRPFSDFPTDYNQLPVVSFVIPNLNHDMHDGTIADGDTWLQSNLDGYIQWCTHNNSLFILTTDEVDNTSSANVLTFFTGANTQGGIHNEVISHYNVLRTIEDLYGLPDIGATADALTINSVWVNVLPLQLIMFDASLANNIVNIIWETATEINTMKFIVERSINNGSSFESIGSLNAKGPGLLNHFYKLLDPRPVAGLNLYRLKEIDIDNKIQYSKIVPVTFAEKDLKYFVYPDPASGFANVYSNGTGARLTSIQLINMNGMVLKKLLAEVSSSIPARLNLYGLSKGVYFIKVESGSVTTTVKILLQ